MVNRIGEIWHGIEIIAYRTAKDLDVQFPDGNVKLNIRYGHLKNNNVKNPFEPNVFGVGYLGVGKYSHKNNPKISQTWMGMLQRCYSSDLHDIRPSYKDCTVHPDWHNFQVFSEWFENNYVEGFHLDKDLTFVGNHQYSSDKCKFIPQDINVLLTDSNSTRGLFPKGVSLHKTGKFQANLSIDNKKKYLGLFNTHNEAFDVYKKEKEDYIKNQAEKYRLEIGEKIYHNLINFEINP